MRPLILLPLVLLAAACGSSATTTTGIPAGSAVLSVKPLVDTSQGAYVEGAIWQFSAEAVNGDGSFTKPRRADVVEAVLPAGLYRLDSASRPCDGNCANLDDPTDACSAVVDLAEGKRTELVVRMTPGQPCTVATPAGIPVPLSTN